MRITEKRTQVILDALLNPEDKEYRDRGISFYGGEAEAADYYGEPGYTLSDDSCMVLLANWNDGCTPLNERSVAYLEAAGYSLEWSDEWMIDYSESKAYRTQADSYSWQPSAVLEPGLCEWLTPDSDPCDVIEAFEITDQSQPIQCVPYWIEPEDFANAGYVAVTDEGGDAVDYRSGWYGREDDPNVIASALFDDGAESVAFQVTGAGQFEAAFTVYRKG